MSAVEKKSIEQCLLMSDIHTKVTSSLALAKQINEFGLVNADTTAISVEPVFPEKPHLVEFTQLPKRGMASEESRIILMHAIAHIEFSAIHLAWDAVCRFDGMPEQYYLDWARIAGDESRHFLMIEEYLTQRGVKYGDFDAHDGLWKMAQDTAHDVLIRMAIVPRVLEARGLDVTPGMIKKLQQVGDKDAVAILEIIYREEITHVDAGSYWFRYLCEQRHLDADETFKQTIDDYYASQLRGPFNREGRKAAGFSQNELDWLFSI